MPHRVRLELDPHPFSRGGSAAICAVSGMHFLQAVLLLSTTTAGNATPLRGFLYFLWAFDVGLWTAPWFLVAAATLGLIGALFRLGWIRLAVFLPQHFFLGIMAGGGMYAAWQGVYLDGTPMSWAHILTDQVPVSVLFFVYSSAIVRRARDPNG